MTCSNCNGNCANGVKWGCQDTMLTTPPAYPTPVGCLAPETCSEVLDSQCIMYTGADVFCNEDFIVAQGASVQTAIQSIVEYFCTRFETAPVYVVEAGDNISVTDATVNNVTTYTVSYTGAVKFVKEFTSSLDGSTVTILGTELAACGIPTSPCNTAQKKADFTYSISYLDGTTWYNITNVTTVEVTTNDTTGDVSIVLAAPSSGDPVPVRVTIIG